MDMKRRRDVCLLKEVVPIKHIIRNWYLHEGSKFMLQNELSEKEEDFLEKVTDFFLDSLDNTEKEMKEILNEKIID